MKLTLQRRESFAGATIGKLYIDGAFCCSTLEDQVREIEGVPVEDWKIKGKTAIPSGTYRISLDYSPRFGADTPTIQAVPGFSHIRIHAGNSSDDTEGCILVGLQATEMSLVGGTSRPAVNLLKQELLQAQERGEAISITVTNYAVVA